MDNNRFQNIMRKLNSQPTKTSDINYKDDKFSFNVKLVEKKKIPKTIRIECQYQLTIKDETGMICLQIKTPCYNEVKMYVTNYMERR